jgi:hypothetical protein
VRPGLCPPCIGSRVTLFPRQYGSGTEVEGLNGREVAVKGIVDLVKRRHIVGTWGVWADWSMTDTLAGTSYGGRFSCRLGDEGVTWVRGWSAWKSFRPSFSPEALIGARTSIFRRRADGPQSGRSSLSLVTKSVQAPDSTEER